MSNSSNRAIRARFHFAYLLRSVRRGAKDPSLRTIARRSRGYLSHATISRVLRGETVPKWGFVEEFLRALDIDEDEIAGFWTSEWEALRDAVDPVFFWQSPRADDDEAQVIQLFKDPDADGIAS